MKIRTGFVSNSSTSSFICLGWEFDEKQLDIAFLKIIEKFEYDDRIKLSTILKEDGIYELTEALVKKGYSDLKLYYSSDNKYYFGFGKSIETDNETITIDINQWQHDIGKLKYILQLMQPSLNAGTYSY
jgi:hypothetical protein